VIYYATLTQFTISDGEFFHSNFHFASALASGRSMSLHFVISIFLHSCFYYS